MVDLEGLEPSVVSLVTAADRKTLCQAHIGPGGGLSRPQVFSR